MTPRLKHYSFDKTGHFHPFSTWQAGQTRKGLLLCKQCQDVRFMHKYLVKMIDSASKHIQHFSCARFLKFPHLFNCNIVVQNKRIKLPFHIICFRRLHVKNPFLKTFQFLFNFIISHIYHHYNHSCGMVKDLLYLVFFTKKSIAIRNWSPMSSR